MERAHSDKPRQDRTGACRRLHGDFKASAADPVERTSARSSRHRAHRHPTGRLQRDLRRQPRHWRAPHRGSTSRHDLLHRLHRNRQDHHASGRPTCDQGVPGTWRQVGNDPARRSRRRQRPGHDGCVRHGARLRAGLCALDPHLDPAVELRRGRHRHRRTLWQHHARPTRGRGHDDGATHRSPTAQSRRGLCAVRSR